MVLVTVLRRYASANNRGRADDASLAEGMDMMTRLDVNMMAYIWIHLFERKLWALGFLSQTLEWTVGCCKLSATAVALQEIIPRR